MLQVSERKEGRQEGSRRKQTKNEKIRKYSKKKGAKPKMVYGTYKIGEKNHCRRLWQFAVSVCLSVQSFVLVIHFFTHSYIHSLTFSPIH